MHIVWVHFVSQHVRPAEVALPPAGSRYAYSYGKGSCVLIMSMRHAHWLSCGHICYLLMQLRSGCGPVCSYCSGCTNLGEHGSVRIDVEAVAATQQAVAASFPAMPRARVPATPLHSSEAARRSE
jgi:hypothetical protein